MAAIAMRYYVTPERLNSQREDSRSDSYSLSASLPTLPESEREFSRFDAAVAATLRAFSLNAPTVARSKPFSDGTDTAIPIA